MGRRQRYSTPDQDAFIYTLQVELVALEDALTILERRIMLLRDRVQEELAKRWGKECPVKKA
jgi:hypothetical protein